MYKFTISLFLSLFLVACSSSTNKTPQTKASLYSDGEIKVVDGQYMAWNQPYDNWLEVESFWTAYAERSGGITWGTSDTYPPYNEVSEFDTFLVEVKEGKCLMEFFHSRWRRANDVRRWDEKHNQYGGCPYVFD